MNSVKVLGIELEVGKKYNHNKWGEYTVLSLSNEKMMVRFGEGETSEVKELTIRLAAQMIFNQQCDIAKALNSNKIITKGNEEQIAYTIGRIAKYGYLCITGIRDSRFEAFKYRYEKATGNKLEKVENISLLCDNANKWGDEYTIHLPKDFMKNEYFALPENTNLIENKDGTYTINDNKFWWSLVEKFGFVLGKEQNAEIIKARCPVKLKENFIKGMAS